MVLARYAKDWEMYIQLIWSEVLPDTSKSVNEGGIAPLGEERDAVCFNRWLNLPKSIKSN